MKKLPFLLVLLLGTILFADAQTIDNVQLHAPLNIVTGSTPSDAGFYVWEEISNTTQGINIHLTHTEIRDIAAQANNFELAFNVLHTGSLIIKLDVKYNEEEWLTVYDDDAIQSVGWISPPASFNTIGDHTLQVRYFTVGASSAFFREYVFHVVPECQKFFRDNTKSTNNAIFTTGNTLTLWDHPTNTNAKALIVAEGFDASNSTYAEFYRYRGDYLTNRLFAVGTGYKVYVLNNNLGNQNLVNNVAVLRSAIEYVSGLNGGGDVVLVGVSAGGVIGRYLLAKADADNDPLPVSLFATFDSPHQGAVIDSHFLDWINDNADNNDAIDNDAAKQLLIYNPYDEDDMHQSFFDELNALNGNGYPSSIPTVGASYSNGSPNIGSSQEWLEIEKPGDNQHYFVEDEWAEAGSFLPLSASNLDPVNVPHLALILNDVEFDRKTLLANPTFMPYHSALDIVDGESKFCLPIQTANVDRFYFHDEVPPSIVDAFVGILRGFDFSEVVVGETFNFTSRIGQYLVGDLDIYGDMFINRSGFSGSSFAPEAAAPAPVLDVSTSSCGITVKVQNNAVLKIGEGTSLVGHLTLKQSNLVIEQGGMVELADNSKIVIKDNSRLHVKSGSTLRITKGSQIIVEASGILEIDANANLDLWWPESNIHIKPGGELRINGNFNRTGLGYFQFDQNNILSFSPSVTVLNLQGEGLTSRLLQINGNATLNFGHVDLNLSYAMVQYLAGAGIIMQNSSADLFGVTFDGPGSFYINEPEAVNARFCDFNENADAMYITNFFAASSSSVLDFWECDFNSCRNALFFSNATSASIRSCNFDGSQIQDPYGAKAIHARNMVNILFSGSNITNYPQDDAVRPVELRDVTLFNMRGGSINNVYTGIWVPCDMVNNNITSVILQSGAIIQNCTEGIHIEQGGVLADNTNYGMVSMRCSKLINNYIGIKGVDILLDIDGCAMNTACMPNSFIRGTQGWLYLDIAYVNLPNPAAAVGTATNNFWNPLPNTNLNGGNSASENYKLYNKQGFVDCQATGGSNPFTINATPVLATAPINCTNTPPNPEPYPNVEINMFTGTIYECTIPMDGQYRMDQEYTLAHWEFISNSNSDGHARFQSIAATPNAVRNAASVNCQHSIDVARVMAQGTAPTFANTNDDRGYEPDTASDQTLRVFPNPATASVSVFFGATTFTVYVYDMLGKQYLVKTMSDGNTLEVTDWPSGLYWLTAVDEVTKERSTIKLVVN